MAVSSLESWCIRGVVARFVSGIRFWESDLSAPCLIGHRVARLSGGGVYRGCSDMVPCTQPTAVDQGNSGIPIRSFAIVLARPAGLNLHRRQPLDIVGNQIPWALSCSLVCDLIRCVMDQRDLRLPPLADKSSHFHRLAEEYRSKYIAAAPDLAVLRLHLASAWIVLGKIGSELDLGGLSYAICLAAYIVCFTSVFLTNNSALPPFIYEWGALPFGVLASMKFIRRPIPISIIFWAALVYLLMIGMASIADPNVNSSMVKHYFRSSGLVLSFLLLTGVLIWDSPTRFLRTLFLVMTPVVALSALVNMIAFADVTPFSSLPAYRLHALFGMSGSNWRSPNEISSAYAIFFIGGLHCLAAFRTSRLQRVVLVFSLPILLIAIAWTQARAAWVALTIAILILAGFSSRMVQIIIVAIAALVAIAVASLPNLWIFVIERGTSFRLQVWAFYLQRAIEHPWLGYGAYTRIHTPPIAGLIIEEPHNMILFGQISGGVAAAAAVAVMLAASIYWAYRYWQKEREITPLLLIVTMDIFGMVEVGFLSSRPDATWMTFWLPVAVCVGAEMRVRRPMHAPSEAS
jgi:O-antigen ligase